MTRMSCNGCRALRKGCSEDCILKPCLQWIESPQSQANATLFLAKFYGRAGIINLINAGPIHLRPAIFRSLLYEACGRIINPVHGSVGLMCSGDWQRCQEAFEAVLDGSPFIMQMIPTDDHDSQWQEQYQCLTPLQGCDIRRLIKDSSASFRRYRFKRSDKSHVAAINRWNLVDGRDKDSLIDRLKWAPSRDSLSVDTVDHFMANRPEQPDFEVKPGPDSTNENGGLGLELSLGLPIH